MVSQYRCKCNFIYACKERASSVPIFRKLINAYTADHLYQIAPKLYNKHEST